VDHRQLHVRWLVAIGAGHGAMRTLERKLCPGMVKLRQILPLFCRVAGHAAQGLSFGIQPRHAIGELTFMDILVTACAAQLLEVIYRRLFTDWRFVAVVARHCLMAARQRPIRLLVFGKVEVRSLEGRPVVALLAAVEPRRGRELAYVLVLVAIDAKLELESVLGRLAGRRVAILALDLGMRRYQGELGPGVVRY